MSNNRMNNYEIVKQTILNRRTNKFAQMTGEKIDDSIIDDLLLLADAAPTHAKTEPWRINVYSSEGFEKLNKDHAQMYWDNTSEETRNANTKSSIEGYHLKASHVLVIWMRRTPETKIPVFEEIAAASAAIQNILIGAEALNLAAFWNTGAMVIKQPMKDYLQLSSEDQVLGFIYLGVKADGVEASLPVRKTPLQEKVRWIK